MIRRSLMLREAEKDLCFALGKLQAGERASAYVNALMAAIHIAQEMTEAEHQLVLLATSRAASVP